MDARSSSLSSDSLPEALAGAAGWRADAAAGVQRSLPEVYGTISVPLGGHWWSKLLAFAGPGYLVSVGYMDPGNWATDLAGGSKFGYTLLSVILISNLMAILLQALAARLGIVTDRDLAQACRATYSRPVNLLLWLACEAAIIACDLAKNPQRPRRRPRVMIAAGLREITSSSDAELDAEMLQQNGHEIRDHDDHQQCVTKPGAAGEIGGPITGVHVADRDQKAGTGKGKQLSPKRSGHRNNDAAMDFRQRNVSGLSAPGPSGCGQFWH